MLNTLSGLKIKPFAARQVQIGNDKAKGVLVNDKFAASVKGLQGMVTFGASAVGKERAESFLAPFTDMSLRLHHYVSKYRSAFTGEYGSALEENLVTAIDHDLELVAKAAGQAS
ncbi:unnamed protein product, partial [Ectocarpus sp. 13 AM-2016]